MIGEITNNQVLLPNGEKFVIDDIANNLKKYTAQFSDNLLNEVGTATFDTNGKVKFENLQYGLYLIKQNEAPKGFMNASPVLIVNKDVTTAVYLKTEKIHEQETISTVTTQTVIEKEIPYTGQNWWWVLMFALVGAVLLIGSFIIGSKEN